MITSIQYFNNGVELTFSGTITSKELHDANTEILKRLESAHYKYQLFIFQQVTDAQISVQDLEETAHRDAATSMMYPGIKVAVVADSPLIFGLGRIYEAYAAKSQWKTEVFYKIEEARAWNNS